MPNTNTLAESVAQQREVLANLLREPLALAAQACSRVWPSRAGMSCISIFYVFIKKSVYY